MDFLSFCKTLRPEDWQKRVNKGWTVKDLVAHMVGWEKEVAIELPKAWAKGEKPWFLLADNYDDFNDFNSQSVAVYRNFSNDELLAEWGKW